MPSVALHMIYCICDSVKQLPLYVTDEFLLEPSNVTGSMWLLSFLSSSLWTVSNFLCVYYTTERSCTSLFTYYINMKHTDKALKNNTAFWNISKLLLMESVKWLYFCQSKVLCQCLFCVQLMAVWNRAVTFLPFWISLFVGKLFKCFFYTCCDLNSENHNPTSSAKPSVLRCLNPFSFTPEGI